MSGLDIEETECCSRSWDKAIWEDQKRAI